MRKRPGQRGFTLVEVLVALAVLAIALTAILRSLSQAIDVSAELRDRTMALWVAQDMVALRRINGVVPASGVQTGEREMGGRRWTWTEQTKDVAAGLRSVDIQVKRPEGGHELARLVSFMGT